VNLESVKSVTRYFRVAASDLVYLKFILEAYEGLATMSTVAQGAGIVRITCGEWSAHDIGVLLDTLGREIQITEVYSKGETFSA
jgi:hypothetical protein